MKNIAKISCRLLGLLLIFSLSAFRFLAEENPPTGYDLVAVVNAYRAANGYYQLAPNSLVMAAAQTHAEWIVETGQGGHIGAGGSDETIRVSWTGYGGGAAIQCDESWASGRTINDAVYSAWTDWTHQEVMLNAWGNRYTDIGGGVAAQGDGRYVFVLNVCMVIGQASSGEVPGSAGSTSNAPSESQTAADPSNYIYGVTLATPQADGTIKHTVLYGQTLISIAEAYGTTIDELRTLNNMEADDTIIWPEQVLLIQPGTGAAELQAASITDPVIIPEPSTTVVIPTSTSLPISVAVVVPTAQATQSSIADTGLDPKLGLMLLGLSGFVLVVLLYFSPPRK